MTNREEIERRRTFAIISHPYTHYIQKSLFPFHIYKNGKREILLYLSLHKQSKDG